MLRKKKLIRKPNIKSINISKRNPLSNTIAIENRTSLSPNVLDMYYDKNSEASYFGSPRGFLSFIDTTPDHSKPLIENKMNLCDSLTHQHFLLCIIFPDFPSAMMKFLLVREQGNSKYIYRYLKRRGWKPSNTIMNETLHACTNELFDVSYYWGQIKPEYFNILKKCKIGSYFTAFEDSKIFIFYKDHHNKIQQRKTSSIKVEEIQKKIFSLSNSLPKPKSISNHSLLFFIP